MIPEFVATIAKTFTFDAAHCLPELPAGHKCARLHGHTYEVEFVLRGPVAADGFVVDYDDIAAMWKPIHDTVDHRYLNEIPGLECPSTEMLAWWMWDRLSFLCAPDGELANKHYCFARLTTIRIKESSTTWCEVSRPSYTKHG